MSHSRANTTNTIGLSSTAQPPRSLLHLAFEALSRPTRENLCYAARIILYEVQSWSLLIPQARKAFTKLLEKYVAEHYDIELGEPEGDVISWLTAKFIDSVRVRHRSLPRAIAEEDSETRACESVIVAGIATLRLIGVVE